MLVALLIVAVAGTVWTLWADWKLRSTPRAVPAPTPVEVEAVWDDRVDGVESKRQMLDRIFAEGDPDQDADPPTVVAERR